MIETTTLTSTTNAKIKLVRQLHQKKYRDRYGLFLIEGTKLVEEAIRAGLTIEMLFYTTTPNFQHQAKECWKVNENLMKSMTTLVSPPSVLAVSRQNTPPIRPGAANLQLITAGIQDPGNFGALLRLAEAMNVRGIWTTHSTDPFHPKVIRGAMGSSFRLPVMPLESNGLETLKADGWSLIATVARNGTSIFEYTFPPKVCLLLGSEGQGLSDSWLEKADAKITIPLQSPVESLNVTLSCAMMLYAYVRQYHHA